MTPKVVSLNPCQLKKNLSDKLSILIYAYFMMFDLGISKRETVL